MSQRMQLAERAVITDRFALCITIASSQPGKPDGISQAKRIPYSSEYLGTPVASLSVTSKSYDFARRLENEDAFIECRKLMMEFKSGPGALWLRKIFNLQNGFERKQLQTLSPAKLTKALRKQLKKEAKMTAGNQGSTLSTSYAHFATMLPDGTFNLDIMLNLWSSAMQSASKMADENALLGFFVTYLHDESDAFVTTIFEIPILQS